MIDDILGFGFPFAIDPATGGVAQASGSNKLKQNIKLILGTRSGERPMLRDFGTRIHSLVHNPNDDVMSELLRTQAQNALLQYEPRVLVTHAAVVQDEGEVTMQLSFSFTTEPLADTLTIPLF